MSRYFELPEVKRRLLAAARIVNQDRVLYLRLHGEAVVAMVRGDSGNVYRVLLNPRTGLSKCTCPASIRGLLCKHIVAVWLVLERRYGVSIRPKPPSSLVRESRTPHQLGIHSVTA